MLSITNVSPGMGASYYSNEGYYAERENQQRSRWFGRLSKTLGLEGTINTKAFDHLLNGRSPSGEVLINKSKLHKQQENARANGLVVPSERAALDCTTSAPKSVSIQALVFGDSRLEEAHHRANDRAMHVLENRCTTTRIRQSKERVATKTGKILIGQFDHDTSRLLDPQLHTHNVAFNLQQLESGQWQSLNNEAIYANKMLLGRIYRNELAREVQALGYEIAIVDQAQGFWEIKGYDSIKMEQFSKRAQQIKQAAGLEASSKEKEWAATHSNRAKKQEIPRQELLLRWQEEAISAGITSAQPTQLVTTESVESQEVQAAIDCGIAHCAEREVAFKQEDIEKFVLAEIGKFSFDQIENAIAANSDLIKVASKDTIGDRFTTQTALDREIRTINLMRRGQGQVQAIATLEEAEQFLEGKHLTDGQRQTVIQTLTTNDRITAFQGKAGVGKSYIMNEINQFVQSQGFEVRGFAPSAEAAKVLGEEAGVESHTVASLLNSKSEPSETAEEPQIWVVDESGLLSAKDAEALLEKAEAESARVILVGDTRQLSAVESGNPFRSLQQRGMQTVHLDESLRQKVADLKLAVDLISDGQIEQGVQQLDRTGRIQVIPDRSEKIARITQDYIDLSPEKRQRTLVLAGTNEERQALTDSLREQLKIEGTLGKTALLKRLQPKDLTQVQMNFSHHYAIGDRVVPLGDYQRLGLEKGKPYKVVDQDSKTITLESSDGARRVVDPYRVRKRAVFEEKVIEIAEGDRLRWTKNDHDKSRRNGQEFSVSSISGDVVNLRNRDGSVDQLDLNQSQHLDHALVATTYSSQGKTADRVFVSTLKDRSLSRESFYVAVSRAKYDLQVYASDRKCLDVFAQESRAKENPLELLQGDNNDHVSGFTPAETGSTFDAAPSHISRATAGSGSQPAAAQEGSANFHRYHYLANLKKSKSVVRGFGFSSEESSGSPSDRWTVERTDLVAETTAQYFDRAEAGAESDRTSSHAEPDPDQSEASFDLDSLHQLQSEFAKLEPGLAGRDSGQGVHDSSVSSPDPEIKRHNFSRPQRNQEKTKKKFDKRNDDRELSL